MNDLEVIVVDDASSEDVAAALEPLMDDRLRLLRLDTNARIAGARNAGIGSARGLWVGFLDDDDEYHPTKLARQLAAAADAGVVYSPYLVSVNGRVLPHRIPLPTGDVVPAIATGWAPPLGSSALVRRDVLSDHLFDPDMEGIEDLDMWLTLAFNTSFQAVEIPLTILDKSLSAGRATGLVQRRLGAIDRLEAKWADRMDEFGFREHWHDTCRAHALVATSMGGVAKGRLSTAWRLARTGRVGRRTRALGVCNIVLGARTTAAMEGMAMRLLGTPRRGLRGWPADA